VAQYTVIYDACVLYPAPLRDLLMQLATANLFRARWTDQIQEEWITNLLENRPDLTREQLDRTKALMNDAVPDCLVTGHEFLIETIELPDPNDRHVVAAAIHGQANAIVTANLVDFPAHLLAPHNLEAIHPDDFITNQIDLNEATVLRAVQTCRRRLKAPEKSVDQYLERLLTQSLPKTVASLKGHANIL
jgi:predicted nucleic acid-binding protein